MNIKNKNNCYEKNEKTVLTVSYTFEDRPRQKFALFCH